MAIAEVGRRYGGVRGRIDHAVLVEALETGAKYARGNMRPRRPSASWIGVVTPTGVGFKISFIITLAAQSIAAALGATAGVAGHPAVADAAARWSATGVVCILMGCGIPTTANYIIMVTVAAPTLVQLGAALVAHFFVSYYGVLADITRRRPWRVHAAYAGMAGSDPQDRQHGLAGWPRRWCRSCSCSRPRCCWWPRVSRGRTSDHLQRLRALGITRHGRGHEPLLPGRDASLGSGCAWPPRC